MEKDIVKIKNLKTYFYTKEGIVKAVDDVSFNLKEGKTLGIVGESGCGKSAIAMSLMGILPEDIGKVSGGEILFQDKNLVKLKEDDMRKIRGNDISLIFQEPMTALNPVYRVGDQIVESIMLHEKISKKEANEKSVEMIKNVGIPRAEEIAKSYPHELSGGMRQRIVIAMALSCNPKVLIADEPTTALDVTVQAQILELMKNLKKKSNTSIILITHDLGVVAEMCDYVVVMYAGKVVEEGDVLDIFENPMHPYTKGLLKSNPSTSNEEIWSGEIEELYTIKGQVPSPINLPSYCYFYDRCEKRSEKCKKGIPNIREIGEKHKVACYLYEKEL